MAVAAAFAVAFAGGSPAIAHAGPRVQLAVSAPVITSAPPSIGYGGSFAIVTPDANDIARVYLVPSASRVPVPAPDGPGYTLVVLSRGVDTLTVAEPSAPDVVPPGHYLVVIAEATLTGLLASLGSPITLRSPPPSPSSAAEGQGPTSPDEPSAPSRATSKKDSARTAHPSSGPSTLRPTAGRARAGAARIRSRRASDRSPLSRFPWLAAPLLIGAFFLTARRLARIT